MLDPLGSFASNSGALIVADPCYVGAHHRGNLVTRIEGAARGRWDVWLERVDDPELPGAPQIRGLIARSAAGDAAPDWRTIERALCFDSAQVGIFDARFFGAKLRAVEAELGAAILGPVGAGVVAGGASSTYCYDPWRVAVSISTCPEGQVVGVRTTWYSMHLRPRRWTHVVDGVEVELHLDGRGLSALLPGDRWVEHGLDSMFWGDPEEARAELRIPAPIWTEVVALLRTRCVLDR